jgi:hypothetical protein
VLQRTPAPTPHLPPGAGPDAAAARIVAEHLQDCGYALLCNGAVLLEGDGPARPAAARRRLSAYFGIRRAPPSTRTTSPLA